MRVTDRRRLGKSGVEVPVIGFGGAPLGNLYQELSDEQARATVQAALRRRDALFDTAPFYGFGLSEHRLGEALRGWTATSSCSRPRSAAAPARATRTLDGGLFKRGPAVRGVLRLLPRRRDALGRGQPAAPRHHRIDILLIHDLDVWTHGTRPRVAALREEMDGRLPRHAELREEGAVRAIGAGINEVPGLRGLRPRRRLRLLPARRPLHPARAGGARHVPALLRRGATSPC